jgi:GNAT superfamily N-acetyltransferase
VSSTACAPSETKKFTITYQVEDVETVLRDAAPLFPRQWEELGRDKDKIGGIAPHAARYRELEKMGLMHCVAMRADGRMVGYYVACVCEHLHYHGAGLMAHTDLYYVMPEFRRGGLGAKMLIFLQETLKARGVVKIYASTKAHSDHGALFEALGFKLSDRIFTKYIG